MEAVAPGFKTFKREGITLQVEDRLTINVALALGQNTEVVSVTGEAPLLRTQDAQTGEVVNNTFIMNLPQLQRDPLQMLTISGNVQGSGTRANGSAGASNNDTRINGGRTSGIDYLTDGFSQLSGIAHTASNVTPGMEDVSEFKVITNGMSAEYGRASGGLVELVTKSGSNELHGQLFEYFQNNNLNDSSWLQNSLGQKPSIYRNNDFGFAVGGPVFIPKVYHGKNKTFFFANYEGVRYSTAAVANLYASPTAAMRAGDFSNATYDGVTATLYDMDAPDSTLKYITSPVAGGINGISYQGCPTGAPTAPCTVRTVLLGDGHHIPASHMGVGSLRDPQGLAEAVQNLYPMPTNNGDSFATWENALLAKSSTASTDNTFAIRLDENITDNQRLFGRFTHKKGSTRLLPLSDYFPRAAATLTPASGSRR